MAKLEIEVSDDGKIGTLPEPLQKFLDSKINEAYGKGAAKAAEESKAQVTGLETQIAELKKGTLSAADRERLRTLETEKSHLEEQLAIKEKDHEKAREIRDKRHADEIAARDAALTTAKAETDKRTARIRELAIANEITAAAIKAGARKESLDELQDLLGKRIALDDALQAFVTDAKDAGKPQLDKDGKAVTVEGFVAQYLTDHPHHKAGPPGRGGGAGGGRSLTGAQTPPANKDDAFERATADPSIANVAAALGEMSKRAS